MINQQNLILIIVSVIIFQAGAQNSVPQRSDISYNVLADSLLRNNGPQDLKISITCGASEDIATYILRLNDTQVLWTVVSAEMNEQPLWLIMDENRADRDNILAWQYDREEGVLRVSPPPGMVNYNLNMTLRINLLRSNIIQKKSEKEVVLLAQSTGGLSRCATRDSGNKVSFK